MKSLTLMSALLLCCWISVSVSHTVDVQCAQNVTLLCSNISRDATQTEWFRVVNRTRASCVSSMYGAEAEPSFCDGFHSRFEMSSNVSTVFLKINRVDLSDSGLYFCGFYSKAHTVIGDTTQLKVQVVDESDHKEDVESEEKPGEVTNLTTMILGALTVLLTVVIIVLAVKIMKLQRAVYEASQTERNKNLGSDHLNYAALSFQTKPKRHHRPASDREMEPNVVYAATR